MTRRVLLHVGAPKTGTSFVQDILFTHRATLRERGILYPADRHDAHFLAALDLMELPWGGLEREAGGAWDRLVAEVREWPGTAIISHEILGTASRVQVARALESLGATRRHRDPHRLLRPRPRAADPGRVAGERQAPSDQAVRPVPGEPPRRAAQRRGRAVVLGRPGGAGRAGPLGGVDPPRPGAPRHRAAARFEPDPVVGAVRRPVRHRRPGVRAHGQGQRLARRTGVGDGPTAQRAAQRRTAQPSLPDPRPRAARAPQPLRPRRDRRGCRCRRTPTAGPATSAGRGSASWRCVGTTSSATSTTWSPGRPCRSPTPTTATSARSPRRRSTRSPS